MASGATRRGFESFQAVSYTHLESIWQYDETSWEEGTAQINGGVLSLEDYCIQMNHMLEGALEQVIDF